MTRDEVLAIRNSMLRLCSDAYGRADTASSVVEMIDCEKLVIAYRLSINRLGDEADRLSPSKRIA